MNSRVALVVRVSLFVCRQHANGRIPSLLSCMSPKSKRDHSYGGGGGKKLLMFQDNQLSHTCTALQFTAQCARGQKMGGSFYQIFQV